MMSERQYHYRALASRVLVVAMENERDWAAYIDAVPGHNHENEFMTVLDAGNKISKELATMLFPGLAERKPWRP